ncbi:hypothetical protein GCM10025881_08660 [Pseudolysinimonas kribbensis]|uniref:DUF58 domain-containing protein n=1 Tax=Pseudolysinimonas kribbensis TaxID=433641 RepID=A0ABQ6K288_9MICO|nr:DUF58 domain-containing protein [Pseudolysinimonas kribbensis]GMA94042.1 hypothetical protein GCM10025881_08660 [Pseudolysinimonas kribbensis]
MTAAADPAPLGRASPWTARARAAGDRLRTAGRISAYAGRRARTVLAPRLAIVSGLGWLVLAAAAGSAVVGFVLGWQEFVYLAITLAAGLILAAAFVFGRGSYDVLIELTPRRVTAGDRALGRMVVANAGQKRSAPSRMELPVGAGLAEFVIGPLQPGAEHEELFAIPTNRRAVIVAGPAVSVRGDQLGLLRRALRWTDPVELFVHPVTTPLAPSAAGLIRDLEGETTKTVVNSDISFHALRPYQPGDPLRNVHWRTTARTGQLMVRQFEETRRSRLTIVFDDAKTHWASDDEFELGVSIMASLAGQVLRDGNRVSVVSEARELRTRTVTTMLDDSCRLERVSSAFRTVREMARDVTAQLPDPSVVIVIGGSRTPVGGIRGCSACSGARCRRWGSGPTPAAPPAST